MSPTLLEIAVAILLLWVAWRIGKLLTPWIVSRWRHGTRLYPPGRPFSKREKSASPINQAKRKDSPTQ